MIKSLFYILALLAINVAVTFAVTLAFILLLFKQDPILAAVPAILAAPAVILQPWSVALFFVPVGLFLKSIFTTIITVAVYGWLNSSGTLEKPKLILSRFKNRKTFVGVGCFLLLAFGVAYARYVDFPSLDQGLPPVVRVAGLKVTDSRYYCLRSFLDSEWLWQARVSESDLAQFADEYDLHPIESNQAPEAFHRMPPYWWNPAKTDQTRVLSTSDFPTDERGADGNHVLASWNPDDNILHVWIKNNF